MPTLRVLIVAYYFPPAGGGGVQRVLSWCRHLGEHDIEVTVLAPAEPSWVDADPTLVVPQQVRLLRTADPTPAAVIPRDALARASSPLSRAATWLRLQPRRLAIPDIHRGWRRPAVDAARAAWADGLATAGHGAWDVIVSTSPPETTHLIAHDLAGVFGIPWIADLRDSWLDLPHLRLTRTTVRLKHAANTRLARRIMRRAAALVTVSEPLASDLRRRHPGHDVHVLPNGVDFGDVARARSRAEGFREDGAFTVLYTGNFFGRQSPATFLRAVEALVSMRPEAVHELVVRFIGGMKQQDLATIAGSDALTTVVERIEFLRHDDVLAQQAAADLLLLYVAPGPGSAGVVTGKLFEYLASGRPILALVPPDGTAARWVLDADAGEIVAPDDVDGITDALVREWDAWEARGRTRIAGIEIDRDVRASIDRQLQVRRLAQLLQSVVDEH